MKVKKIVPKDGALTPHVSDLSPKAEARRRGNADDSN
jgi:hypothetical protein